MSTQLNNVYFFITNSDGLFVTCTQDAFGNYSVFKYSAQPFPIKYPPTNFADSPIEFATNNKYFSLTRNISYPLDFINDGASILNNLYLNGKGIEQKCYLTVVQWSSSLGYYQLCYKGRIDFKTRKYSARTGVFSVATVDDSAWGVLSNNDTTTYRIDCSSANPKAIKVLVDGINLLNNYTFQTVAALVQRQNIGAFITFPFALINQDGDSYGLVVKSQTSNYFSSIANLAASTAGALSTLPAVNGVSIIGSISFNAFITNGWLRYVGDFSLYFYTSTGQKFLLYKNYIGLLNWTLGTICKSALVCFNYNVTVNLAAGEQLFLVLEVNHVTDSDFQIQATVSNTTISIKTKTPTQVVYGLRPIDALQDMVNQATLGRYTIKSNFFKINNKIILTSGNAIRNSPNPSIYTSFEEFFMSYDPKYFLAMRIINGDLYIEPVTDIYPYQELPNPHTIFDLGEVLDCEFEPATDYYANEIEAGSPNQDYRHPSGRLETNSTNLFSLPFLNVKKKMSLVTKYRTGCYDIQFLILDYQGNSTQDNSGDSDTYMIDISDTIGQSTQNVSTFQNVTINNSPLAPIIKSPISNDLITYNKPIIRGIAPAGSTVKIYADTVLDGSTTADGSGNWSYALSSALSSYVPGGATGVHTIQATYTDLSAPNTSITLTIYTGDTTATAITSHSNGNGEYNNLPLIKGVAQQGTTVNLSINGISVATLVADASCKWSYKVTTPIANGNVTISANAVSVVFPLNSFVAFPLITYVSSELDGFPVINNIPLIKGVGIPGTTVQIYLSLFFDVLIFHAQTLVVN